MKQLANALVLFTSLGCKVVRCLDPGVVYGFGNVSLVLDIAELRAARLSSFLTSRIDQTISQPYVDAMLR